MTSDADQYHVHVQGELESPSLTPAKLRRQESPERALQFCGSEPSDSMLTLPSSLSACGPQVQPQSHDEDFGWPRDPPLRRSSEPQNATPKHPLLELNDHRQAFEDVVFVRPSTPQLREDQHPRSDGCLSTPSSGAVCDQLTALIEPFEETSLKPHPMPMPILTPTPTPTPRRPLPVGEDIVAGEEVGLELSESKREGGSYRKLKGPAMTGAELSAATKQFFCCDWLNDDEDAQAARLCPGRGDRKDA